LSETEQVTVTLLQHLSRTEAARARQGSLDKITMRKMEIGPKGALLFDSDWLSVEFSADRDARWRYFSEHDDKLSFLGQARVRSDSRFARAAMNCGE